ncbi:hypothetical protein WI523_13315 [Gemmatimonadota bacterium CCK-12]
MMIEKGGQQIASVEAWLRAAPPKSGEAHWKDGRSAKECAQAWVAALPDLPGEVVELLSSHPDFSPVAEWTAEPEAHVPMDAYRGPPNIDVMVRARDGAGPFVVAVEAKADETFGRTVAERLAQAERYLAGSPGSKAATRVREVTERLVGQTPDEVGGLYYQLFTAAAAALSEAERAGNTRAVLLIHEFVTDATKDELHTKNAEALDRFAERVSDGKIAGVEAGQIAGPIRRETWGAALYLGKAVRQTRSAGPNGSP